MERRSHTSGFTIVEIIVGLSIFTIIFLFIAETLTIFYATQNRVLANTQALYLAEAGQEYVRFLRDEDWATFSALSTGNAHYLDIGTSTAAVTGTPEVINGTFTRRFVLWPAYRNGDEDLVASTTPGASVDTDSFWVVTLVNWDTDEQIRLQSFLGNLHDE